MVTCYDFLAPSFIGPADCLWALRASSSFCLWIFFSSRLRRLSSDVASVASSFWKRIYHIKTCAKTHSKIIRKKSEPHSIMWFLANWHVWYSILSPAQHLKSGNSTTRTCHTSLMAPTLMVLSGSCDGIMRTENRGYRLQSSQHLTDNHIQQRYDGSVTVFRDFQGLYMFD